MSRNQLAAVEDLHRLCGDACLDLFAEQPERYRVEMLCRRRCKTLQKCRLKFPQVG